MIKSLDIDAVLASMSLEEKASLCSGNSFWTTQNLDRAGIKSLLLTDGPHGLRKQSDFTGDFPDLHDSVPATCFPSAAGLAATWNREKVYQAAQAIGREAAHEEVAVLLGPGVNMKRSPLCGRNFEYFSEDPFLAGSLGASHVQGVQSNGIGACVKHFAVNNQESNRMVVDVAVSERALREIYLPAFEIIIREANPWMVMCAYNKVNGEFCSQNARLLHEILREEWDYDGVMVTDWGACDDRVKGLVAGQDLEMPSSQGMNDQKIVHAVENKELPVEILDRSVRRFLTFYNRAEDGKKKQGISSAPDLNAHHRIAVETAEESLVLLKNEDQRLPLAPPKENAPVAFIGELARTSRIQGGGSSHIHATRTTSVLEAAQAYTESGQNLIFSPGYRIPETESCPELISEAISAAENASQVVLFAGLTDAEESEGFDRDSLELPAGQRALIRAFADKGITFTLVLTSGAPVTIPSYDHIPSILYTALPGQGGPEAIVRTLFGDNNPSGKLAETFPLRLEDTPCFLHFPGTPERVSYQEDIWIGYRYYDAVDRTPLFPFGHGHSYTEFSYDALEVSAPRFTDRDDETLQVRVRITNTGSVRGKEVVQLYVHYPQTQIRRPVRELKGFEKTAELAPSESATVHFTLSRRDFCRYDEYLGRFVLDPGTVHIEAAASSRDIRCRTELTIETELPQKPLTWNSQVRQLLEHPRTRDWIAPKIPDIIAAYGNYDPHSAEARMMEVQAMEMPVRNVVNHCSHILRKEDLLPFLDES
ncbi:glycoside hydrolase family 3 C-terminal domain-containing protein [Balneolaceae bacterium ANBcel3]|nr:glycoside hydrolase family 3 C-terminal domain-containing protein [Balneolaceae bacterium ANBcel3]